MFERLSSACTCVELSMGTCPVCCELQALRRQLHEAQQRLYYLEVWRNGVLGATMLLHPPNTGPHTKEAHYTHKRSMSSGPAGYKEGASTVLEAVVAMKGNE